MLKRIAGRLAWTSIVAAFGLVLGSVAWADEQTGGEAVGPGKKHSEEMNKGKSHEEAREATKSE